MGLKSKYFFIDLITELLLIKRNLIIFMEPYIGRI
jgi:hypothetical protein